MSRRLELLRDLHADYLAKWKAEGKPVLSYEAPCCGSPLETTAPSDGETWDSFTTCPQCGELHFKVVTAKDVTARVLEGGS